MKVQISDVVVHTREVDLPTRCPNCEVLVNCATSSPVSLDWNFGQDTLMQVHHPDTCIPIPAVGYCCEMCGELLAWGQQAIIDSHPPKDERATLWGSRGLDRLVLRPESIPSAAAHTLHPAVEQQERYGAEAEDTSTHQGPEEVAGQHQIDDDRDRDNADVVKQFQATETPHTS